jgi:hypothetical protein
MYVFMYVKLLVTYMHDRCAYVCVCVCMQVCMSIHHIIRSVITMDKHTQTCMYDVCTHRYEERVQCACV